MAQEITYRNIISFLRTRIAASLLPDARCGRGEKKDLCMHLITMMLDPGEDRERACNKRSLCCVLLGNLAQGRGEHFVKGSNEG